MASLELFRQEQIIGVFRGFREGGLEFHADLVLPYRNDFQSIPMHGQFLLVQLETPEEAVLGRIASFSSEGKLSVGSGEEFNIRAMRENRPVPEDLREQYLKYKVNIRVLGVLRKDMKRLIFVPSHRRLPHVGSPVALPSGEVLQEIAGHNISGTPIGHFALGEYVYAQDSALLSAESWMQIKSPEVLVRFSAGSLVSRRSFVFARAGFGKSNLNKLLFSKLYETTPTVVKRGGKVVPVGTIIFDPDGEYFWPDDKGRPGLCDVPALQDKLVVFTSRKNPSPFYQSFVAGGIKLDIRLLRPSDVIAIALSPERQEQQNVRKLSGLDEGRWGRLVNLIDANGNQASLEEVGKILDLQENRQEAEALAARANMTTIVRMLHDKSSQLMDMLVRALSLGKLCVVDVSQMRGGQALVLSGLILRHIFDRNQKEFTSAEPKTIPTIAVIEEAQAVLRERAPAAEPYIAWVKEGRKYDLGALLITQQPGSIPTEILSQGDNWFIFHLLSAADLTNVRQANAHFSDDLLSTLLNEPIPGQGVYWSSVDGKPYPISLRTLSFEKLFKMLDPNYDQPAIRTYAEELRHYYNELFASVAQSRLVAHGNAGSNGLSSSERDGSSEDDLDGSTTDIAVLLERHAVAALRGNRELMTKVRSDGVSYGRIGFFLRDNLPEGLDSRDDRAFKMLPRVLNEIFGPQDECWHSFMHPQTGKRWVKEGKKSGADVR